MKLEDLKHREDIGLLLNSLGLNGIGVEVGVLWAENAECILKSDLKTLFLVDLWEKQKYEDYTDGANGLDLENAISNCIDRLKGLESRYAFLKMSSDKAASLFAKVVFDFVYLDANHHNPQFEKDLNNWFPLVKKGGIFGGHDYYDLDTKDFKCEVKSTVDKFVKKHNLVLHLTEKDSWWIQK